MLKRRLAGNQVIIAYMQKVAAYKGFVLNPILFAKRQNIRFQPTGGQVILVKNDIKVDFIFEVVRKNPGWEEKFMEKMKLYQEFYENFQAKDCGFDKKPQLVIVGEDNEHIIELFKCIKRVKAELKNVEICYSTDLKQLEDEIDKTLTIFKQDSSTGRYYMEIPQIPLLEGNKAIS